MPKYRILAWNDYSKSCTAVEDFECPAKEVKKNFLEWVETEGERVLSYFAADRYELVKVEVVTLPAYKKNMNVG